MTDIFSIFQLTPPASLKAKKASPAVAQGTDLEATCEQLILLTRAMWELLSTRAGVSEQDLLDKVAEIDLRDGTLDGKMQAKPLACEGCGNSVNASHVVCIYCGAPLASQSAFDALSR
jgi:hypothetical protein